MTIEEIIASRFDLGEADGVSGPLLKAMLAWLNLFGHEPFSMTDLCYSLNSGERSVYRAMQYLEARGCVERQRLNNPGNTGPRMIVTVKKLPLLAGKKG